MIAMAKYFSWTRTLERTEAAVLRCSSKYVFLKFHKIHLKTPKQQSFFNKEKKRLLHWCFRENFVKFVKHLFYKTPLGDCFWRNIYNLNGLHLAQSSFSLGGVNRMSSKELCFSCDQNAKELVMNKWDEVLKSGPSEIFSRLSSTNFTWAILEYLVPNETNFVCN